MTSGFFAATAAAVASKLTVSGGYTLLYTVLTPSASSFSWMPSATGPPNGSSAIT